MNLIPDFPLLMFALSFVALALSAKTGDALRKRVRRFQEDGASDFGVVLTGTLTLLGLIIGFSISMAISRYDLRKNYEQAEANAIAIEFMRADLLPAVDAARVHELLKTYLDLRVSFYTVRDQGRLSQTFADTARLQNELWSVVRSAIAAVPPPLEGLVVSGMNDIVLSQRSSQAASWNRVPVSVWVLMALISLGCNFLIGYRARRTDWLVFLIMPVAVSISLFLIADLDSPLGGAIRVVPHNLISLSQFLHST
jgi:hypothetical protein